MTRTAGMGDGVDRMGRISGWAAMAAVLAICLGGCLRKEKAASGNGGGEASDAATAASSVHDAPMCMQCGVTMQRAGSCHACPSCGATSGCS